MLTGKGDVFRVWPTMPKNSVQEAALLDSMIEKTNSYKKESCCTSHSVLSVLLYLFTVIIFSLSICSRIILYHTVQQIKIHTYIQDLN